MKKITALSVLFVAAACFGCNQHDHPTHQKQTRLNPAQHRFALISLPTMQCNACAETIQKTVEKVEGVQSVSVDLKEKTAHVDFDPIKTSQEKIKNAVAAAGYDANKTKRDEKAHAKLPKCCQSTRE